jgi:hypothetical protein
METTAESPPVCYSKLAIAAGSNQPVPVDPATIRDLRFNPPARSRSATARAARSSRASFRRRDPGVGPDRFLRGGAGERGDLGRGRALPDEVAALPAQGVPGHQRTRATRPLGDGGLDRGVAGGAVPAAEDPVGHGEDAVDQHPH